MLPKLDTFLADESATAALAARCAPALQPGLCVWLEGPLGAGKTAFVRGLLRALGWAGTVKSPTYTLVEPYAVSSLQIYHFDLYRMQSPDEWFEAGFDDLPAQAVRLVEWPERCAGRVTPPDWVLGLAVEGAGRRARLEARSARGEQAWNNILTAAGPGLAG